MKLLTKRGQPLLLLPAQPQLAAHALALYPAQTARGRLARFAARWILTTRLPIGIQSVVVNFPPDHAFSKWLASLTPDVGGVARFAVLAGNANSPGQRLILLLFDARHQPAVIVKAGFTEVAKRLIAQERQFFESLPDNASPGEIPRLRGAFANDQLVALAMDFLPGHSPGDQDERELPRLLSSWVQPLHRGAFAETRVGRELTAICCTDPVFQSQMAALQEQRPATALFHGDFAPWNVRVSPQRGWMVLDWERGALNGPPAWDWFHYVIQKAILVQRQSPQTLVTTIERLLASPDFQTYLQHSHAAGCERALLLLYLLHQSAVVRPSEGLTATQELLQALATRWR